MEPNLDKDSLQATIRDHIAKSEHPLLVLLGITASGKTGLSLELAKNDNRIEIVNADSRQLFQNLDIGTGKISSDQMQGVPHHLFDVLDPNEEVTVGWYKEEAEKVIDEILDRGNVPMLVGGSMLYISSVTDGLSFDPEKSDEMRGTQSNSKYDLCIFGLWKEGTQSVVNLNNRIDEMFNAGWIEEVQGLIDQGYSESDPAMKSVGYKEIMRYIKENDPSSMDDLKELISAKTRQYAKRQRTWWRNDERIQWIT